MSHTTSDAIVIHAAHDLRVEPQTQTDPGPGEVAVAIASGGICGSDLHYYHHGGIGTIRIKEPMILGHEVAGHITALGANVSGLTVGQLVAVSPSRPCHACRYCHEGQQNHCLNMRFYGSAMPFPHIQGAFRQSLVADASQCVPSDGLSPAQAALAEPLAVCLHAARQAGPLLGKHVLVTGSGPIGQLCILAARRAGAAQIVATDLTAYPLDIARTSGADTTLDMSKTPQGLNDFAADKGHFDVLFECTGVAAALIAAIPAMRPGGVIVQVGLGGDMTLPLQAMTAKELQLRGSFRFHAEFATGVTLMRQGLIDAAHLVTQTIPFTEARAAFDLAGDRSQAMKVQLAFG